MGYRAPDPLAPSSDRQALDSNAEGVPSAARDSGPRLLCRDDVRVRPHCRADGRRVRVKVREHDTSGVGDLLRINELQTDQGGEHDGITDSDAHELKLAPPRESPKNHPWVQLAMTSARIEAWSTLEMTRGWS